MDALQGGACTMAAAMTSAQQLASLSRGGTTTSEGILRSLDAVVRCNSEAQPREAPDVATAHHSAHDSFCMRSAGAFNSLADMS